MQSMLKILALAPITGRSNLHSLLRLIKHICRFSQITKSNLGPHRYLFLALPMQHYVRFARQKTGFKDLVDFGRDVVRGLSFASFAHSARWRQLAVMSRMSFDASSVMSAAPSTLRIECSDACHHRTVRQHRHFQNGAAMKPTRGRCHCPTSACPDSRKREVFGNAITLNVKDGRHNK